MHTLPTGLALLFQNAYGMTDSQTHWLMIFAGCTAVAVLVLALSFGGIAFALFLLLRKITEFTGVLEKKVYPVLDNVKDLMNDSVPKVKRVTTNIAETSDVYRAKLAEIEKLITETGNVYRSKLADVDSLITDTTSKAKRQSDRVDGMVSSTLHSAGTVVGRIENAVLTPVRQGGAWISGLKTAAEHLVQNFTPKAKVRTTPKPVAFEGESVYTGLEDDYHA